MNSAHALFFLCLQAFSCQDTSKTVVDYFPDFPFLFKLPHLVVPDSLGGNNLSGNILVQVELDSFGKILSHRVIAMALTDTLGKVIIDYRFSTDQSDHRTRKYASWLREYVQVLSVKRKPDFSSSDKMRVYRINLPIKITPRTK